MAAENIVNINNGNFNQEVEKSTVPVLVDFWAPWCGPCRAVAPVLEGLATKYGDKIKIGKLNVDEESALASRFRVMSIPTLILFKGGLIVQQVIGYRSAQELENLLQKVL